MPDRLVDDRPHDHCGVFGAFAPGEPAAKLAYFGLFALQHRGQESAGIAASDGQRIVVYKDMGLVSQVFSEANLATLPGSLAVGHNRYSTTGASVWGNAQPTFHARPDGGGLALAHNGNLTNTDELRTVLAQKQGGGRARHSAGFDATSDTDILTGLLCEFDESIEDAALSVLPMVGGAFSLAFMTETTLYAARDRYGLRPLCIGQLSNGHPGWVVASESAALDIVGASFVRDVEPGELVIIDAAGIRSRVFADPKPKACLFEFVYLSRPDTLLSGRRVHNVRVKIGRRLAQEQPAVADMVIPVPDSGTPAAIGYAAASGIQYGHGLVKSAYVGRTFIEPTQALRRRGIRLKLNPLRDVVSGKRLVVVDDSIVRGNTQQQVVAMLREAGATQVHVRISSPPVLWPCFFGIDFATRDELIAAQMTIDEMADAIGADSLGFVSLDALIAATHVAPDELCRACFDGDYPLPLPDAIVRGNDGTNT